MVWVCIRAGKSEVMQKGGYIMVKQSWNEWVGKYETDGTRIALQIQRWFIVSMDQKKTDERMKGTAFREV